MRNDAPPEFPSLPRRLASMCYELLLLFAVLMGGFLLPHVLLGMLLGVSVSGRILVVHLVLLLMAYYVWFWTHGGQTVALKTWKMKIVDRSGAPPRLLQAIFRYLLAWPSLLCCGAGILWALFDQERQFLHDRIADTRIVFQRTENGG
ncbi:MAG: RDD family protein [Zoogloeaceae bacterium]|jgi:uncharacterized RDD family membrane protein YckC|nr:RDD family protein [Zoogloeaceae bacterium]